MEPAPHRCHHPDLYCQCRDQDSETGGLSGDCGERPLRPEYPKRMMKYACRDFPCIRGYIRPGKASLSETTIFNLLITRHKTAPNLQGTKPAVWLAVRSVSCQPVSPGFLRKSRGNLPGYRDVSVAGCRPAISCRTPVSRVEPACGRRAGNGYCQGVGNRPDRLSTAPVQTGHPRPPVHTAPRLPPGGPSLHGTADRTGSPRRSSGPETQGRSVREIGQRDAGDPCPSPASAAHGPAPAIPVLPPAIRTGPVKPDRLIDAAICRTRSAERVRDFRAQGMGFQGTGTSGGNRPVSGMRAGPERVPSREGFFAAGHAGPSDDFFTAGIPRIRARTLRRFSRAFQGGISFRMTRRKYFPQ